MFFLFSIVTAAVNNLFIWLLNFTEIWRNVSYTQCFVSVSHTLLQDFQLFKQRLQWTFFTTSHSWLRSVAITLLHLRQQERLSAVSKPQKQETSEVVAKNITHKAVRVQGEQFFSEISCWVKLLAFSKSRHSNINTAAWSRSVRRIWWGRVFAVFTGTILQQMSVQCKKSVWKTHTTHFQDIFLDMSLCLSWRMTWQQQWSKDNALKLMLLMKKKLKEKRFSAVNYSCVERC